MLFLFFFKDAVLVFSEVRLDVVGCNLFSCCNWIRFNVIATDCDRFQHRKWTEIDGNDLRKSGREICCEKLVTMCHLATILIRNGSKWVTSVQKWVEIGPN